MPNILTRPPRGSPPPWKFERWGNRIAGIALYLFCLSILLRGLAALLRWVQAEAYAAAHSEREQHENRHHLEEDR